MRRPSFRVRAVAAGWAIAASGAAHADGIDVYLEPGVVLEELDTTDEAGITTHLSSRGITQNYQLLLDKELLTNLRFSSGGSVRKLTSWIDSDREGRTKTDDTTSDLFARLMLGAPTLRVTAGADRRHRSATFVPTLTTDRLSLSSAWRPVDLPELDLVVSRTHDYAPDRTVIDDVTNSALLTARYTLERLDLRYLAGWAKRWDGPTSTETRSVDQTLQAIYSDAFFGGRTRAYASATVANRLLSVSYTGTSGEVERQQFPVSGLSAVETPPRTSAEIALAPNAALVDGDLRASAAVNLGYRPALAGDRDLRDVGARLADLVTEVNRIYVWVDARLPPDVAGRFNFTAWRSDDNLHWTAIGVTSTAFGQLHDRFEISIEPTRARHVKVVTAALQAVTAETRFIDIFVTEIQLATVVAAASLPTRQSTTILSLAGTATTAIVRGSPSLSHDLSVEFWRLSAGPLTAWTVVNGLSYGQKLSRAVALDARVGHRDQDVGSGHEGQTDWAGSLVAKPLPALHHALTYSGTYYERLETFSNALTLNNRADVWEGITAQATLGASVATLPEERTTTTALANAVVSFVPNRFASVSGGWFFNRTRTLGDGRAEQISTFHRVGANVSVTPGAALSAFGTVSRIIAGMRPTTLASLQLNYTPFRGDLQLGVGLSRTLDTAADATTKLFSPTLRWNVRSGVYLNAAYSLLEVDSPVATTRSRAATASLVVYL